MYKNIIFDLDGTLINTEKGILKSINFVLNEMGLSIIDKCNQKNFIGPPIYMSLQKFYGLDKESALEGHNRFRKIYEEKYLFDAVVYDNIQNILGELHNKNYKLGVATYKKEEQAVSLLKYFSLYQYFDVVKGSDVNNVLTKTSIVSNCLLELNVCEKSDVILIGDSYSDFEAAYSNRIDFLGVTYGFGFSKKDNIDNIHNIHYVGTPIDILGYIG